MDPNTTLRELDLQIRTNDVNRIRYVEDLESWLRGGGFAPDWIEYPAATEYFLRNTRITLSEIKTMGLPEVESNYPQIFGG